MFRGQSQIQSDFEPHLNAADNGGRRSGVERRQYINGLHIPERRGGEDRRCGRDRRQRRY